MKETAGNLKKGTYVIYKDSTWLVVKTNFSFHGRGMANVKIKLQDTRSNKNIEITLKSVQEMELADISLVNMNYLYKDKDSLYFMDENYEQYLMPKENIGKFIYFLKEGEKYLVLVDDGKAINIRKPEKVSLLVTNSPDAVKGDTAMTAKKLVETQTGFSVLVPLFIKKGDSIAVNPETGEYLERKNT